MKFSLLSDRYIGQPMFGILSKAKELEKKGKKFIHFELGDPDYGSPSCVRQETCYQIRIDNAHYAPSRGIDSLLKAAADVTERSRGFRPTKEQLLVTPGANIQIYLALACCCDGGQGAAIVAPYFPSYIAQCAALGIKPVVVDDLMEYTNPWYPRVYGHVVRVLILNSPCNPSGKVYSKEVVEEAYKYCRKKDILLISDEVYARMIFEGEFFSASMIDRCKERVLVVNGFSKAFAMTGYRLGVATGPEELIRRMMVLQETILSCVPPFIQEAGVAALKHGQEDAARMVAVYKKRRDLVCGLLKDAKFDYIKPDGGLYVLVKSPIEDDGRFAEEAIDEGVLVSPGKIFGAPGWFRIAFCVGESDIICGVLRLCKTRRRFQ